MKKLECTAIILAGGKSSRMGQNKALLPLFNKKNIENIAEQCKNVAKEVIVVTNDTKAYAFLGLPLVEDNFKDCGPLAGLEAGLKAASYEKTFVVACDMPFFQGEVIHYLIDGLDSCDAVVPNIMGTLHPLLAAYQKTCLTPIQRKLQENKRRIIAFFDDVKVRYVTENDVMLPVHHLQKIFFNMNTPEEYDNAKKLEREINPSFVKRMRDE